MLKVEVDLDLITKNSRHPLQDIAREISVITGLYHVKNTVYLGDLVSLKIKPLSDNTYYIVKNGKHTYNLTYSYSDTITTIKFHHLDVTFYSTQVYVTFMTKGNELTMTIKKRKTLEDILRVFTHFSSP